jgi:hypothetical protein
MRTSLFLVLLFGHALAQDTDSKLAALEAKINSLTERLTDFETAGVHLYKDRSTCPEGFYPMENADGRFLLISGSERGEISDHTSKDEKIFKLPCSKILVGETGFAPVCAGFADGTAMTMSPETFIPFVKLLGCIKNGGPQPVI